MTDELGTLAATVAILIRHASRRTRREILQMLDAKEAAMTSDDRGWPDESQDPPDRTAPIGDRQWVPENVLAVDGQRVTMRWIDEETGIEREDEIVVAVVPEMWKEAARRRGQDVDA